MIIDYQEMFEKLDSNFEHLDNREIGMLNKLYEWVSNDQFYQIVCPKCGFEKRYRELDEDLIYTVKCPACRLKFDVVFD